MSLKAPRTDSTLAFGQPAPRVDAELGSILKAVAERVAPLSRRDERILVEFGEGAGFIVDLATGAVSDGVSTEAPPTVTLSTTPRLMARILNGTMDPRSALLYGWMKHTGRVESGVQLCDELAGKRFRRQEVFTDLPLPAPTTDLTLALRQLREYGYCIVKDALSKQQLERVRTRLDDQAAAEYAAGLAYLDGGRAASKERRGHRGDDETYEASAEEVAPNQRVWCLQNKGDEFLELLDNSVIDEIVCNYLDEDYPLAAIYSANIVGGGGEPQFLHQDQIGVQPTTPFAVGVNIIFCLDDFVEANGATRIVPGSHIAERGLAPDNIYSSKGTVPAEAPAGSAILVETRLWHGTGASTSTERRRAAIVLFQRSWTRGASTGVLAVHPTVLQTMSDRHKAMFGHRITGGLGSIQTEPEGTMVGWNPDQLILKMHSNSNVG